MTNGGGTVDGRTVRIEKARRNQGYDKTPGRCKLFHRQIGINSSCNIVYTI